MFSNNRENVKEAKKCIVLELNKPASASDLEVSAIGHAHIDTGWLWPVRETIRKCARTFSTQLSIIDDYQIIFLVHLSHNTISLSKSIIQKYIVVLKRQ